MFVWYMYIKVVHLALWFLSNVTRLQSLTDVILVAKSNRSNVSGYPGFLSQHPYREGERGRGREKEKGGGRERERDLWLILTFLYSLISTIVNFCLGIKFNATGDRTRIFLHSKRRHTTDVSGLIIF